VKFQSKDEAALFLVDCGREDLIEGLAPDWQPDAEMLELFLRRRQKTVSHLKSFRKKQQAKQQWRHGRYDMMKGIKAFHSSTKGKKFHRSLGRFLSTRVPLTGDSAMSVKDMGDSYLQELGEVFKALSSYKTHAWIELENFMTVSEQADYEIFLEEAVAAASAVESELMKPSPTLPAASVDFLLATLNHNFIFGALEGEEGFEAIQEKFSKLLEKNVECEFPFVTTLSQLK
jgi:hypothetical protein